MDVDLEMFNKANKLCKRLSKFTLIYELRIDNKYARNEYVLSGDFKYDYIVVDRLKVVDEDFYFIKYHISPEHTDTYYEHIYNEIVRKYNVYRKIFRYGENYRKIIEAKWLGRCLKTNNKKEKKVKL
jgi:hypothetical protein